MSGFGSIAICGAVHSSTCSALARRRLACFPLEMFYFAVTCIVSIPRRFRDPEFRSCSLCSAGERKRWGFIMPRLGWDARIRQVPGGGTRAATSFTGIIGLLNDF
ncbi:hypothetical protein NL676_019889 [Syzygium grande]|nr:hypothetical protein NL676_019889 [Syzygium grande]